MVVYIGNMQGSAVDDVFVVISVLVNVAFIVHLIVTYIKILLRSNNSVIGRLQKVFPSLIPAESSSHGDSDEKTEDVEMGGSASGQWRAVGETTRGDSHGAASHLETWHQNESGNPKAEQQDCIGGKNEKPVQGGLQKLQLRHPDSAAAAAAAGDQEELDAAHLHGQQKKGHTRGKQAPSYRNGQPGKKTKEEGHGHLHHGQTGAEETSEEHFGKKTTKKGRRRKGKGRSENRK